MEIGYLKGYDHNNCTVLIFLVTIKLYNYCYIYIRNSASNLSRNIEIVHLHIYLILYLSLFTSKSINGLITVPPPRDLLNFAVV